MCNSRSPLSGWLHQDLERGHVLICIISSISLLYILKDTLAVQRNNPGGPPSLAIHNRRNQGGESQGRPKENLSDEW